MVLLLASRRGLAKLCVLLALPALGCAGGTPTNTTPKPDSISVHPTSDTPSAPVTTKSSNEHTTRPQSPNRIQLGKSLWFENQNNRRRVVVGATVCLREGSYGLEFLLCRTHTKEHESVLSTDADAQLIHAGLIACGGEPGAPVDYVEKDGKVTMTPPHGTRIKVTLEYEETGKVITVPAQSWVRNSKTKKELDSDWVFAGSRIWMSEEEGKKRPVYLATGDGAYISVCNVPIAMLDLPIDSPTSLEGRAFEPFTQRIPPLDTQVNIILEPQKEARPSKKP